MTTLAANKTTRTSQGRLPEFLIIGAMKAGTTTFYEDLSCHPAIFLPEVKEPDALRDDNVFHDRHLRAYAKLFSPATDNQLCGEGSTSYTKRPTYEGVPERSRRLLGDDLKIIYLVRDPVQRALSHHRYLYQRGFMAADINEIIHTDNTLIDYSRYAMQIDPWLNVFGRDSLHAILLEDFAHNRQGILDSVCDFLQIPRLVASRDDVTIHNRTADLRPLRGFWRNVRDSSLYLNVIRPLIPGRGRSKMGWLRQKLAQDQLPDPPPATMETKRFIANVVRDDALRFSEMTGVDISAWKSLHETGEAAI